MQTNNGHKSEFQATAETVLQVLRMALMFTGEQDRKAKSSLVKDKVVTEGESVVR